MLVRVDWEALALGPPSSPGWEHPGAGVGKAECFACLTGKLCWGAGLGTSSLCLRGCWDVARCWLPGSGSLIWVWGLEASQLPHPCNGNGAGGWVEMSV